jgi:hypothetical protein
MDPVSLAALAAPILAKGAEAFSKAAGERLGEEIDQLSQAVINKLKGDSYAEQTLSRAREKPESLSRREALKEVLADKMNEDPKFAEEISKLVEDIQKDKASISTIFIQNNQQVETQTNIGNVQNSVNISKK